MVYRVREGEEHLFADAGRTIVGHNLKPAARALFEAGHGIRGKLFDIMVASYLLNSSTRAHDLPSIALRELGKEIPVDATQTSLFGALDDARAAELFDIRDIYERFVAALSTDQELGLFEKVEMKLIPVLARMEMHGVAIDTDMLAVLSKEVVRDIDRITKKIWKEAGMEFNVSSSVQLRRVLFEKMQLPLFGIKKGKTGLSTAASELEKLRGLHPIIELIESHREFTKLQNTYIDVLPTLVNPDTGRVHTTFNQAVTTTGRLSSSDPNLQNIPIRTELGRKIRDAFVASPGSVLVAADYSQIELRIVASLAEDKTMIKIFEEGKDIHAATAAVVNRVPLEKVTKEMRSAAKEVNFGVLYGMGAYGLSSRTGMSQAEAEEFIRKYFEQFAGVKAYIDQTLKFVREAGYVETLFGRRRYIPELKASNFQVRSAGERMAVNMPIQGTAADLMKMAMISIDEKIHDTWNTIQDVKMILQVHDELVFEVKKGLEDEVAKTVKKEMEEVAKLRVPIEAHVSIGDRWGELK
jgi:DNA polymerase-1